MMRSLTPIFSILIAILLYLFFIAPQWEEVKGVRAEVNTYQEAVERYDQFTARMNGLLELKRNQNPVTLERLNQLVPEEVDAARIITDLEDMARRSNMLFGNITTSESEEDFGSRNETTSAQTELQAVDISFELIGTYDQLQAFLLELESSLTLLEVTGLSFSASNGLFEQFALTVRAYALPQVTK